MSAEGALRAGPPSAEAAAVADRPTVVLGISASAKPPPGTEGNSAVRSYLQHMLAQLRPTCSVQLLDLRDTPLPLFDGRMAEDVDQPNVRLALNRVRSAGALLMAVPAYWNSVGAVFKNFCEVLAGPAYDLKGAPTVFHGKPIGLLVVGADAASADSGAAHSAMIMAALGANLIASPVMVGNPRHLGHDELKRLDAELLRLAAATALAGHRALATAEGG